MTQVIVGAGMAGLLAARMLRGLDPIIYERASALPNNHNAVLRFASPIVGDVLGIPFRRVNLIKTVLPWRNPVADAMAYSWKSVGEYRSDRSVLLPERWQSVERWIAPEDLIESMAYGLDIEYGNDYDFAETGHKVISTIPMFKLARAMAYPSYEEMDFKFVHGSVLLARVAHCDSYVTIQVPDPSIPFYRASITGNLLIVEFTNTSIASTLVHAEAEAERAARLLGLNYNHVVSPVVRDMPYAKMVPLDEGQRRNFIHWASTVKKRAFQLGRYATWRPRLQLDDVVNDVRVIERWIKSPSPEYDQEEYERKKAIA